MHASAFKLEHRFSFAVGKELVGVRVIERDFFKREIFLTRMAAGDEIFGQLQNRERSKAQEVELYQTHGLHIVFVVLAHGRVGARLLIQRCEIGELARCDQNTTCMHAHIARHAFKLLRHAHQGAHFFFAVKALLEHWLGFERTF